MVVVAGHLRVDSELKAGSAQQKVSREIELEDRTGGSNWNVLAQTHRQADRETHTDKHSDRQTDRQSQTDRHTHRHTDTQTGRHTQTHRQTHRQTDRQTHTYIHIKKIGTGTSRRRLMVRGTQQSRS